MNIVKIRRPVVNRTSRKWTVNSKLYQLGNLDYQWIVSLPDEHFENTKARQPWLPMNSKFGWWTLWKYKTVPYCYIGEWIVSLAGEHCDNTKAYQQGNLDYQWKVTLTNEKFENTKSYSINKANVTVLRWRGMERNAEFSYSYESRLFSCQCCATTQRNIISKTHCIGFVFWISSSLLLPIKGRLHVLRIWWGANTQIF